MGFSMPLRVLAKPRRVLQKILEKMRVGLLKTLLQMRLLLLRTMVRSAVGPLRLQWLLLQEELLLLGLEVELLLQGEVVVLVGARLQDLQASLYKLPLIRTHRLLRRRPVCSTLVLRLVLTLALKRRHRILHRASVLRNLRILRVVRILVIL